MQYGGTVTDRPAAKNCVPEARDHGAGVHFRARVGWSDGHCVELTRTTNSAALSAPDSRSLPRSASRLTRSSSVGLGPRQRGSGGCYGAVREALEGAGLEFLVEHAPRD